MCFIPSQATAFAAPQGNFSQRENTKSGSQAGRPSWEQPHKCTPGNTKNRRKMVHHRLSIPEGCIQLQIRISRAAKPPLGADLASLSATIKCFFAIGCIFLEQNVGGGTLCPAIAPMPQQRDTGNLLAPASL